VKLLVLCDLHLEFLPLVPAAGEADVVVLAGDIDLGVSGISWGRQSFPDRLHFARHTGSMQSARLLRVLG